MMTKQQVNDFSEAMKMVEDVETFIEEYDPPFYVTEAVQWRISDIKMSKSFLHDSHGVGAWLVEGADWGNLVEYLNIAPTLRFQVDRLLKAIMKLKREKADLEAYIAAREAPDDETRLRTELNRLVSWAESEDPEKPTGARPFDLASAKRMAKPQKVAPKPENAKSKTTRKRK